MQKHDFGNAVKNVLLAEGKVLARTGDGLYEYSEGNWLKNSKILTKRFLFYDDGYFETDYIPDNYSLNPSKMEYLIPQASLTNPTIASLKDQFFVCVGNSLFEYKIARHYYHTAVNKSVRDIFFDDSLKVISTYSGIYINDSIKLKEPTYSNGHLTKIEEQYFLCVDGLHLLKEGPQFVNISNNTTDNLGAFRKLIVHNDQVYAQLNNSIAKLDSVRGWLPLIQEHEFLDITSLNNRIYFSTTKGLVFESDGYKSDVIADIGTAINDLYVCHNRLYLGSDKGLFVYQPKTGEIKILNELPKLMSISFDLNDNLWLATENGLFYSEKGKNEPLEFIPDVEFNRGAIKLHNGRIYVGAISGLYSIDFNEAIKEFFPKEASKFSVSTPKNLEFIVLAILIAAAISGYYIYQKRKMSSHPEKNVFNLDYAEKLIADNDILSVDELAEYLNTNTVQLNRIFKNFDTTPGKFLKKTKLKMAKELLSNNVPIHKVVKKVGYSANFIKKNI